MHILERIFSATAVSTRTYVLPESIQVLCSWTPILAAQDLIELKR
jgi:hypothetical protein